MEDQPLKSTLEMTALLAGYLRNTISDADRIRLEEWLAAHESNRQVLEELLDEQQAAEHWQNLAYYRQRTERARLKVAMAMENKRSVVKPLFFYRAAAAAVLILLAAGTAIWWMSHSATQRQVVQQMDVLPGTERAQLVIGKGRTINLDNREDTTFVQGAAVNVKSDQGLLAYEYNGSGEVQYHQLITPRGGQYHLRLEDGTDVWLNAASSIRFPTRFEEGVRSVEVTGEAYFEVAQDASRPFEVRIDDRNAIDVLGTRFNVNAYKDGESIVTTLLQGSVRVYHAYDNRGSSEWLKISPGAQAVVLQNGQGKLHSVPADTTRVMAWKNGYFDFNDVKLAEVMRQISRWYDIDIVYEKGVPDIQIWGKMERNQNLQQLIRILNKMDVQVKLDGNRLKVLQ